MMPMMLLSPERKGKENMHSIKPQRQQPFFLVLKEEHVDIAGRGGNGLWPGDPRAELFLQGWSSAK